MKIINGIVFPFLFETRRDRIIKLNWENSEFKWIDLNELENYVNSSLVLIKY